MQFNEAVRIKYEVIWIKNKMNENETKMKTCKVVTQ